MCSTLKKTFALLSLAIGMSVFASLTRSLVGSRHIAIVENGEDKPYDAEVEYLRNDGLTQYIDTGILGCSGLRVIAEVTPLESAYDRWIIGSYDINARMYIGYQYHSERWGGGYGNYFSGKTNMELGKKIVLEVEYTDTQQILTVDGEVSEVFYKSGFTGNVSRSLWLFGLHYTDSNPRSFLCEIGRVMIYVNGEMVRDFIPVRLFNVGYMYDTVTESFFCNGGEGTFTVGPDL